MHILEAYATNACLKIDKPFIYEKYYPLDNDKFITLHHCCKFDSRQYDHWDSVIRLLKPVLDKEGIDILQIGTDKEKPVQKCKNLLGKTEFNQLAYIIKRAMLHVGVDSFPVHLASGLNTKIVSLYSNMHPSHSKPYWSNDEDVVLIESDKEGDKPTYGANETPKTINTVKPEEVAAAVCKLLDIDFSYDYETIVTGQYFHIGIVEAVPEEIIKIGNMGGQSIYLRLDIKEPNIKIENKTLEAQLSVEGKYTIITRRTIPSSILKAHRKKIDTVVYIVDENSSINFYNDIISCGIKCNIATEETGDKLDNIKFKFLDYPKLTAVEKKTQDDVKQLKDESIRDLFYQSNKFLIHKGKFYPSQAAFEAGSSCGEMDASVLHRIPDKSIFFKDLDHVRILKKKA
jgi:hypothetical protein